MRHNKTVKISRHEYDFYSDALNDCIMNEDETRTWTAIFSDGIEMDVKVCGVDDEPAWTEAVLFDNGYEVACDGCYDELIGEWPIEYKGNTYTTTIRVA